MIRKFRLILLFIAVLTFTISAGVAFQRHKQTADIISISGKTTAWTLVRLESEYMKFIQLLHQFALKDLSPNVLRQRFDILWSRTDILLIGNESKQLREQADVAQLVQQLQATLAEIEPVIFQMQPGRSPEYLLVRDKLEPFYVPIRDVVVNNFRGNQAHFSLQKAESIQKEISFYLLGLLLSGTMLIALLIHEGQKSRKQALHDSLTGLPNRLGFSNHLATSLAQARREKKMVAVHILDLNSFKEVNDTLGHSVGDALLVHVANTLRNQLRSHDLVARLGGDEFAIIQTDIEQPSVAASLAERLSATISQEVNILGNNCFISASIGISLSPQDTDDSDQLLINADMAMYRSKADGSNNYCFFEAEMNSSILRRKALADDLRKALESNQLKLVYQPIMDLKSGQICTVEALLRWQHEEYGHISPLEVVSIAEHYGLATQLNNWVLLGACEQNRRWQQQGLPAIQVAVNISPSMYMQDKLINSVTRALQKTGLQARYLILEVTEDTTMRNIEASPDILMELRQLGIALALDDFGTGHSSLSHLRQLPVQRLKIDKSFLLGLDKKPEDIRFIRTVIALGKNLGMKVVAEGIETAEHLEYMKEEDCEMGQGYYLCRPAEPEEIEKQLLFREKLKPQLNSFSALSQTVMNQ